MEKDFQKIKSEIKITETSKKYINHPLTKVCSSALPLFGSFLRDTAESELTEFQKRKHEQLLEYINSDNELINTDMINDVRFITDFKRIIDSVNRLSINDKIFYFANLIKNGYLKNEVIDASLFDEYFYILNSISFRQLAILEILYKLEKQYENKSDKISNIFKLIDLYWSDFIEQTYNDFQISNKTLISNLHFLQGYGLFEFVTRPLEFGESNFTSGRTTEYYKDMRKYIYDKNI